jgi:hypothetical protein
MRFPQAPYIDVPEVSDPGGAWRALPPSQGWQPIETAPKGHYILVTNPSWDDGSWWQGRPAIMAFYDAKYAVSGKWEKAAWEWRDSRNYRLEMTEERAPTHWMPLPEPPK